jgi:hypothetical protein
MRGVERFNSSGTNHIFAEGIAGMITGKTLIAWGYRPGPWFAEAIAAAQEARLAGYDDALEPSCNA